MEKLGRAVHVSACPQTKSSKQYFEFYITPAKLELQYKKDCNINAYLGWSEGECGRASENMAELCVCGQLTSVPMTNITNAYAGARLSMDPPLPSRTGNTLSRTPASGSPVAMLI